MQLIFDTEAETCIDEKMALIDKETINEKFTTDNIIEKFSNNISNGNRENIENVENIVVDKCKETNDANSAQSTEVNCQDKLHLENMGTHDADAVTSHTLENNRSKGLDNTGSIIENIKPLEEQDESIVNKTEKVKEQPSNTIIVNIPQDIDLKQNSTTIENISEVSTDSYIDKKQEGILSNEDDILKSNKLQIIKGVSNFSSINEIDDSVIDVTKTVIEKDSVDSTLKEGSSELKTNNIISTIANDGNNENVLINTVKDKIKDACEKVMDIQESEDLTKKQNQVGDLSSAILSSPNLKKEKTEADIFRLTDTNDKESSKNQINNVCRASPSSSVFRKEINGKQTKRLNDSHDSEQLLKSKSENSINDLSVVTPSSSALQEVNTEEDKSRLKGIQGHEDPAKSDNDDQSEDVYIVSSSCPKTKTKEEKPKFNDKNDHKYPTKTQYKKKMSEVPSSNRPTQKKKTEHIKPEQRVEKKNEPKKLCIKSKLTLDILSDEEDTPPSDDSENKNPDESNKQCINIEDDDDDIMLIEDDNSTNIDDKMDIVTANKITHKYEDTTEKSYVLEDKAGKSFDNTSAVVKDTENDENHEDKKILDNDINENKNMERQAQSKPLLPKDFLSTYKKKFDEMTRNELEEFCILKIAESIVDRCNLGEITAKIKNFAQSMEELKNKAKMLTKQNNALQVVLKSVQEEVKKNPNGPITPLKISRSVGIQVLMSVKHKNKFANCSTNITTSAANSTAVNKTVRGSMPPPTWIPKPPQNIPVPRLVPATSGIKNNASLLTPAANSKLLRNDTKKAATIVRPEKRTIHKIQNADTVDLTDDEPPSKMRPPNSQAVRLVPPQNLMAPPRSPLGTLINSPRKVYIPISGGQGQNVRPGQTFMLRTVNSPNIRPRSPATTQKDAYKRTSMSFHPAPLPESAKQCQRSNWKAIPPAPEIKLSKVENGIVISWKLDNYKEDNHETIASYQIYAYQETASPPSTSLWKKIGDVKALPLPMACTLTQFVSGYRYFFAVRAVDVRSRFGPFSVPSNIMLINK